MYKTMIIDEFTSVTDIERFYECIACKKKIILTEHSDIVKCTNDACKAITKSKKLKVNATVKVCVADQWLTMFSNTLGKLVDVNSMSDDDIASKLILLENIKVTFDEEKSIIIDIDKVEKDEQKEQNEP